MLGALRELLLRGCRGVCARRACLAYKRMLLVLCVSGVFFYFPTFACPLPLPLLVVLALPCIWI